MKTLDIDSKLAAIESRYEQINNLMAQPETLSDPALLERYGREYSSMTDVVQAYKTLQSTRTEILRGRSGCSRRTWTTTYAISPSRSAAARASRARAGQRNPAGSVAQRHHG